ncbi:MAG: glycosyltransferase, partial [Terriglobia bacterium]
MESRLSTVSVIVPAFNEEGTIGELLQNLRQLKPEEIIVADGSSTDRTAEIAAQSARVVASARGRGVQMNAGARESSGDVLLFLHADVHLGSGGLGMIRESMRMPSIVGGNFDVRYQGGDWVADIFTRVNRWRRRVGILYGDSGI